MGINQEAMKTFKNSTFIKEIEPDLVIKNRGQAITVLFTPVLQKPEIFRVKASEGEIVVIYFEPARACTAFKVLTANA